MISCCSPTTAIARGPTGGWALAFWLIQKVAGPSPFAFHLTSLALHVVCSLIVFWLAMTTTRSRFAALTAGLLFGLTDAHVAAVAWPCAALNVIPAAIPILLAPWLASMAMWVDGRSGYEPGFALRQQIRA